MKVSSGVAGDADFTCYHRRRHQQSGSSGQSILHWATPETSHWQGNEVLEFTAGVELLCFPFEQSLTTSVGWCMGLSKQEYDELLHEFMTACKQAYGEKVLVQVLLQ